MYRQPAFVSFVSSLIDGGPKRQRRPASILNNVNLINWLLVGLMRVTKG